jgi:hypothetical protein
METTKIKMAEFKGQYTMQQVKDCCFPSHEGLVKMEGCASSTGTPSKLYISKSQLRQALEIGVVIKRKIGVTFGVSNPNYETYYEYNNPDVSRVFNWDTHSFDVVKKYNIEWVKYATLEAEASNSL